MLTFPTSILNQAGTAFNLADSLTAYWKLDNLNDSVGSSHLANNFGVSVSGGEATFGGDNFLDTASNPALVMGDIDFTIALMVQLGNYSSYQGVLLKWNSGPVNSEYGIDCDGGRYGFFVRNPADSALAYAAQSTNNSASSYQIVIGKHDAGSDRVSIKVNDGSTDYVNWDQGCRAGSANLTIGAYSGTNGSPISSGSKIKWAGIWKRLLTGDEESALYNNGNGLEYPF